MSKWVTEVYEDPSVFRDIAGWWDARSAVTANPFLRSAVLSEWRDGLINADSRLHVRLLLRDGEPKAALPLYRIGRRYRSMGEDWLVPFGVLVDDDPDVIAHLGAWINGVASTHLYAVAEASPLVAMVPSQPRWFITKSVVTPYIDLSGGLEGARAHLSGNFRSWLRRRRRQLEALGEVTIEESTETGELFDAGVRLESSGWKGASGTSMASKPEYEGWYRLVAEVAAREGWLRLVGVRSEGRLVGFDYDLTVDGRRHLIVTAYDEEPAYAHCSPGMLAIEASVESGVREAAESYELGAWTLGWKRRWTPLERQAYTIHTYGSTLEGRLAAGLYRARQLRKAATPPPESEQSE